MQITVKKADLLRVLTEVYAELENNRSDGIELTIEDNKLYFGALEAGGLGCCMDFDCIQGLTEEEILELP